MLHPHMKREPLGEAMPKTAAMWVTGIGVCALSLTTAPAAAQPARPGASPTLIPVENRNPALTTDRHLAAISEA